MNQEERETLANFRFSLIAPLVTKALSKGERQQILTELAGQTHLTSKGEFRWFSVRTLERYVAAYEKDGPVGLIPKVRKDAAHCRVIPPDLLDKAVALKLETPTRSVRQIIRILELTGSCPEDFLKPSTLNNHLYEAEAVQKLLDGSKEAYRRYEMAYRNQVWQADTHHTLYLPHPKQPDKRRLAYLIVFLDDYSRLITHGEFFFEENVLSLEQVFKKAILKHGIPEKLYVDYAEVLARGVGLGCIPGFFRHSFFFGIVNTIPNSE